MSVANHSMNGPSNDKDKPWQIKAIAIVVVVNMKNG